MKVLQDSLLLNYITFDESTLKMSYNGVLIQGVSTQSKFGKISITFADSAGSQQIFEQSIIIHPPAESVAAILEPETATITDKSATSAVEPQ